MEFNHPITNIPLELNGPIMWPDISQIKCDTPVCGYRDNRVQFKDYPEWINKPCPKCGGNLLTNADMDTCIKSLITIDKINRFGQWLPKWLQSLIFGKKVKVNFDMNGSGKLFKD